MSRAAANNSREELKKQIDYPDFDIQNYIDEYKGRTRIQRLMFLADRCPAARKPAVQLLLKAAQSRGDDAIKDKTLYREIFKYGKQYLENCPDQDVKYLQQNEELNMITRTKLEDEIQKWRNLTQRNNSRLAHLKCAAFLSRLGDFDSAIHKLTDAKEFAEIPVEMIDCQMQIILTSVKQGSLSHVHHEAQRMFVAYDKALNENIRSQIHVCMGLFYLRTEKFNLACNHFLQATHVTRPDFFSEILSKREIGIYGALCALGDLKRDQLKAKLVENHSFMDYLDKAPYVKNLVYAMTNSQYSRVMELLGHLKKDFLLDFYLHKVADALMNAVRGKALVQYFEPFSSMNLTRMAKDFGVKLSDIEEELHKAILSGQVKAKIDLSNHTLIGYQDVTDRHTILKKIVDEGEVFCREAAVVLCNLHLTANKMDLNKSQLGDHQEGGLGEMNNNKYRKKIFKFL